MTHEETNSRASLLANPDHWPLFYHTALNMEPRQLAGIIERHLRHAVLPRLPVDFDARYEQRIPEHLRMMPEPIQQNTARLRDCLPAEQQRASRENLSAAMGGNVTFLNTTIRIDGPAGPDWFHPESVDQPVLWGLKLHGFEFLNWPVLGTESAATAPDAHSHFRDWIRDWSRSPQTEIGTEQYLRRAWTPHAVSLRILNWCRYYGWCAGAESETDHSAFLATLRELVYKNALFLERHLEHDIGGNHLIENGAALAVAGALFERHGERFLDTGLDILSEARSQFLGDGGHFERSPMYHVLTLTRYLTVLDVLQRAGRECPDALEETAGAATRFLRTMRPPDGRLPLLNDAVFGEALPLDACLSYAQAVGITPPEQTPGDALTATGLYWLGEGEDRLLVDGGRFGPPKLPAHSHNDLFSVLVWVDGERLITDTGTYEYAPTARRQQARSVRGHNTVQVGSAEPIDVGGQYLAGKRVDPRVRYVRTNDLTMFDGSYRKAKPGAGYRHRRQIFADSDWWFIQDTVTCDQPERIRSRLNFHPDVTVESREQGDDSFRVRLDGTPYANVLPVGVSAVTRTTSPYFPEFGSEIERTTLVFESPSDAESHGLFLSKEPYSSADLQRIEALIRDSKHGDVERPELRYRG